MDSLNAKRAKQIYDAARRQRPEIRQRERERSLTRRAERAAYREENRAALSERNRAYRQENRNALLESRRAEYVERRGEHLVRAAKYRAMRAGVPHDLRASELEWPEFCPVFGVRLNYDKPGRWADSPSLDRMIPSRGYVKGNVRVICMRANRLKGNATPEELKALAKYAESFLLN